MNGVLTCVSPEESAKQKVGTEDLFLVTKSTHVAVLSDLFVVLFLDKESLTKAGWCRTQHGERAIRCDIARVNILTFFEHHIAWLYVSGIVNCLTYSILLLLHLLLEVLLHIKYQCVCLWRIFSCHFQIQTVKANDIDITNFIAKTSNNDLRTSACGDSLYSNKRYV